MKKIVSYLKLLFAIGLIFLILAIATLYLIAFAPNVSTPEQKPFYIYIPRNANMQTLLDTLNKYNLLNNQTSFLITAKLKRFHKPKPGRYKITHNMSNNQLINKLRAGLQEPINVTFNNIRTKEQFAKHIAKYFEFSSNDLLELLNNDKYLSQFGFTSEDIMAMFIPNTYQFYWTTTPKAFITRMYREYLKFWTPERLEKAKKIGLTPKQVIILASIVQAEQMKHPEERPIIAGLYINRLKRGMPLQADPTVIYAWGDFSIKRVYNYHKQIDSPYNTYKYKGLPPGPIITPDINSIDAVLNYVKHDYLYMVAKPDFSGYHHFSKTLSEHLKYARMYQQKLNQLGIR